MIHFHSVEIGYKTMLVQTGDLVLKAGEIYSLIGSNGSGKTTFLHTLIGKKTLLSGTITLKSKSLISYKAKELARQIAFVEAKFDGVEYLTVREYISMGRTPHTDTFGRLRAADIEHVENAIRTLCLEEFTERFTTELSDGERQLIAIARALAQDTSILVLDEPTAFLDYGNRKRLIRTLSYIANDLGKCILFSTHDIDLCLEEKLNLLVIDQATRKLLSSVDLTKNELLRIGFNFSSKE